MSPLSLERWLGELAEELRNKKYCPRAVRRVLIPKPGQPGRVRPLGIPTIRDRVAQTAAMLILEPIFEADLPPEQHAYRVNHSALDAVRQDPSPSGSEGQVKVRDVETPSQP